MKRFQWFIPMAVVFVVTVLCAFHVRGQQSNNNEYVEGQLIVKVKDWVSQTEITVIQASLNASVMQRFTSIDAELWDIQGTTVADAIDQFQGDARLEYIEPDYILRADEIIPNDPRFSDLWGLHNLGQTGGIPDADIDAPEGWDLETGEEVLVGVIDTGVDWTHEDLADNIYTNPGEVPGNGVDDDGNGFVDDVRGWDFVNNDNNPFDDNGHGTHVSGTVAAIGNNGIGVVGVSWSSRILPIKFLSAGGFGSTANAILSVEYATLMGVRLTNNSWGGGSFSQALRNAIAAAGDAGILFVAAAGNGGSNTDVFPHYPSSYDLDNIISVANTTHSDQLSGLSNYGLTSVDLGAPGTGILSTVPGDSYSFASGTSMASPHVAGAVSLLWSAAPTVSHLEIKDIILSSTDPIPALAGRTVSGGRLNIFNILSGLDSIPPAPVTDLQVVSTGSNTATLTWTATGDDGTEGTASVYDLRYSTSQIYWSNFDSAMTVEGEPVPQPAGTPETFRVQGLDFNTTYYFALTVLDEQQIISWISNLPSGTTLGIPQLAFAPDSLSENLLTGGTSTQVVTISNTAEGTLDFSLPGPLPTWLTANPRSGRLFAGDSLDVDMIFNATGLSGGDYNAGVVLTTNDPNQPTVSIDVHLQVTDAPDIALSDTSLDYGERFIGFAYEDTLTVTNIGTDSLHVSGINIDNPEYSVDTSGFMLAPSQSRDVVVTLAPVSVGAIVGTLSIHSDDPDQPQANVSLQGVGLIPPDIAVSPDSLSESLLVGQTSTRTLIIENTGGSDLTFALEGDAVGVTINQVRVIPQGGFGANAGQDLQAAATSAGNGAAYSAGHTPSRDEMLAPAPGMQTADLTAGNEDLRILLFYTGDVTEIRSFLLSLPDVSVVDTFDGLSGTPTLDQLLAYHAVIVMLNNALANSDAAGNVLADYADAGGGVIVTLASFISGWEIRGRFLSGGYAPFTLGAGPVAGASLGAFDATHPIMQGVTSATGDLLGFTTLAAGASWVADWNSGLPFVATQGDRVVGVNIFTASSGFWTGDVPVILRNAVVWSSDLLQTCWLDADPTSGVIPANSSLVIDVTFDATSTSCVSGGDFADTLLIVSNDPDEPQVVVPVHLHVTDAPHIILSDGLLDFGPVFVGATAADTVRVTNAGSTLLTVDNVVSDNGDYTVNITSFTLNPGQSRDVSVVFAPSVVAPISGTVTISSNDPDEPTVAVALQGEGLDPPVIGVSPDSLSDSLFTGGMSVQPLTIANSGGNDLVWSTRIAPEAMTQQYTLAIPGADSMETIDGVDAPPGNARTTAIAAELSDLTDVLILWDRSHGQISSAGWGTLVSDVVARGATVTESFSPVTSELLEAYDMVWLTDGFEWNASEVAALAGWVETGGGVLFEADNSWNTVNELLSAMGAGIVYSTTPVAPGPTTNIFPHETTVGVSSLSANSGPLSSLSQITLPAGRLVDDQNNLGMGAYSMAQRGRVVALADELFHDISIGQTDNQLFGNQVIDWLSAGVSWLSVDPSSGTVSPGSSLDADVIFDATGLDGGPYDASIVIENNDPLDSRLAVPVHLHVTGAADIAVSDSAVDYGQVFIGATPAVTLVVCNEGTDVLVVSNMTTDHGDFSVDTTSFNLNPGQCQDVEVTFAPSTTGTIVATLTIDSNDPDQPTLSVALQGEGLEPPVIGVSPPSLSDSLFTGGRATQTLTISNDGVSDLEFEIAMQAVDSVFMVLGEPYASVSASRDAGGRYEYESVLLDPVSRAATVSDNGMRMTSSGEGYRFQSVSQTFGFSVLYFSDMNSISQRVGEQALVNLGVPFTGYVDDYTGFLADLATGAWDIVLYESAANSRDITPLIDYVAAGGKLISSYWAYNPAFAAAMEATYIASLTTPLDVSKWRSHAIFTSPNAVPDLLAGPDDAWFDNGDRFEPAGGAVALAGYTATPTANQAAIVLGNGEHTILNGMIFEDFLPIDSDGDGKADIVELVENEIVFLGQGVGWLSADPTLGTVPAGFAMDVDIIFDASGLPGGPYEANVLVASNDPLTPQVTLPVHLQVTGAPHIAISDSALAYGAVFVGATPTDTLVVSNEGTDVLLVSDIVSDNGDYTVDVSNFSVNPGTSQDVEVTFAPSVTGPILGTLTIDSNDPDEPMVAVVLQGEGLEAPVIAVSPDSLSDSLFTGQTSVQTLAIANEGGNDLTFNLTVDDASSGSAAQNNFPHLDLGKGEVDPRVGDPVTLGSGGPDGFGYRWIDSDELGGPVFDWVEISGMGTPVFLGNDGSVQVPLPFVFSFYGEDKTQVLISANGYLTFGTNGFDFSNDPIPDPSSPNDFIAAFWDDLYPGGGGSVYYYSDAANDRFIVEYQNVPLLSGGGPYTFEVILNSNGTILLQYLTMGTPVTGSTTGIENGDGTDGLQMAFNTNYVHDNLAVSIGTAPAWLNVDPAFGTVVPGSTLDVTVTYDASGLPGGPYDASIVIASNDPISSQVTVPAHLHVTGAPDIAVADSVLDYGPVFIGAMPGQTLVIANQGTDDLSVTDIVSDNGDYTVDIANFSVNPGASQEVEVTFAPSVAGVIAGTLTILSNDADEPAVTVALTGTGVEPPVVAVSPDSLSDSLLTDETSVHTLTIGNEGDSDLEFDIAFVPVEAAGGMSVEDVVASLVARSGILDSTLQVTSTNALSGQTVEHVCTSPDEIANVRYSEEFTSQLSVALVGSDGTASLADVQSKLVDTGVFNSVTIINTRFVTPTVMELQAFDGVMVYSAFEYADPVALGNNLADYVDGGGGVVSAMFEVAVSASFPRHVLAGRWESGQYYVVTRSAHQVFNAAVLGTIHEPAHPTVEGVSSFDGGTGSYRPTTTNLTDGSTIIASWSDGMPLVAVKPVNRVNRVDLGFYPTSSDVSSSFWQVGTDGDLLMANALAWVAGGVSWLSVDPGAGVVAPGTSLDVTVTFDATGLLGGDYDANIVIVNNDPLSPEVAVPAHLHVTGVADIAVSDSLFDFGSVFFGLSATLPLVVSNSGNDDLVVSDIATGNPDVTVDVPSFTVAPGDERTVQVAFAPTVPGAFTDTLSITSNDPDEGVLPVLVLGEGLIPPQITVSPDSLLEALFAGDTSVRTMTIGNPGGSSLIFSITVPQSADSTAAASPAILAPGGGTVILGSGQQGEDTRTKGRGEASLHVAAAGDRNQTPVGISQSSAQAAVSWLILSPLSGAVAPDSAIDISVTFDASGLLGGLYDAEVIISTNIPGAADVVVPIELTVTGSPTIAVSDTLLDFGDVFIGYPGVKTLRVSNTGSDVLTVSDISPDLTEFSAVPSSFALSPGDFEDVAVTFSPTSTGAVAGVLTISNDDASQSSLEIDVVANALQPPVISVSVESLMVSVPEGDVIADTITVANIGESDLVWRIGITFPASQNLTLTPMAGKTGPTHVSGSAGVSTVSRKDGELAQTDSLGVLGGVNVLWHGDHGFGGIGFWSIIIADIASRGAVVTQSSAPITPALLNGFNVLWFGNRDTVFTADELDAVATWASAGGSVLVEADSDPGVAVYNQLMEALAVNIRYINIAGVAGPTPSVFPHETTVGVDVIHLQGPATILSFVGPPAGVLVDDLVTHHVAAYSLVGSGRALVVTDQLFWDFNIEQADNRVFANQVFNWFAELGWLSVDPTGGTLAAGDSIDLLVEMDATGLVPGSYQQNIDIVSNDPTTPMVTVPVILTVDTAVVVLTGIDPDGVPEPSRYALHDNYPNPFNPTTTIRYDLPEAANVLLELYSIRGERVRVLVDQRQPFGRYDVQWDGRDSSGRTVASGVYFYKLRAGGFVHTKKMLLLK